MTGVILRYNSSFEKALKRFTEASEKKQKTPSTNVKRRYCSNVYN